MPSDPCADRLLGRAAGIAVAALFGLSGAAHADSTPISAAETLLFMTPHLGEVRPPTRLHYAFKKSGTLEQGFSDTVDIDITGAPDGSKKGVPRFFSGRHEIKYPEVEHVEENPVLLFYLDREVREMARLTGGMPNHFQKMMRTALAESAQVKDVDIRFGGRKLRAQQIAITPFDKDQYRDKYPRLAGKRYTFTMCEAVPGFVYEVRGLVPAASGSPKDAAVIDETLTLKSASVIK